MDIEIGCESSNPSPSRQTSRNINFWVLFFCSAIFKVVQGRCLKEDCRGPQQNSEFIHFFLLEITERQALWSYVKLILLLMEWPSTKLKKEIKKKEFEIKVHRLFFFVPTEGSLKNREKSQSLLIKCWLLKANWKPRAPANSFDWH